MRKDNLATKVIIELNRTIKAYKIVLGMLSVFTITSFIGFAIALTILGCK